MTSRPGERPSQAEPTTRQVSAPAPGRLRAAHRALDGSQRLAGAAALALAASIFLPWWRDPVFGISYIGFRRITFVELAILLVSAAVLALLLGRAERRAFHLPLADGTLIAAAGAWSAFLVVFRILDPPTRTLGRMTHDYGLRWGALIALASALVLALAGVRERRKRHPGEPESVAADADATPTVMLPR